PAFDAVLGGGRYGMTFPVGDPEGLADRLSRVLGDTDLRSRLARQGLARAREYDWSRVGEQVVAVYESVRTAGEAQVSLEAGPRPWGRGRWRRR
ncbi:glycosyltransferase, partial [Ornithinicoccus halotolerans]|uniref:glycosyltransferase n=1 Tax=Ornithinicoccus halotolerans TaxID=1748220 RepID=UPI00188631C0